MTVFEAVALFLTAIVAGGINSVAGGGSFFTFPMLLFVGIPPVSANATNTLALWPGSIASVGAYRRELSKQGQTLFLMGGISLAGGIIGAWALLRTRDATFAQLIPWLLLVATLIFAFSGSFTRWLRARNAAQPHSGSALRVAVPFLQLITAIFGGFFGGGIGILMLAMFALMGMENIHEMNALKTVLATLINGVAVVLFVSAGAIQWPQALVMIVGAIIGGYGGAAIARVLEPRYVRRFVIVSGVLLTIYFFIRPYLSL